MFKTIKNAVNAKNLRVLQSATMLSFAVGFISLLYIPFSWPMFALTIFMYFLTFGFGVSATFHRTVTHKSIHMHPLVEMAGKFFASMGGTGSPISWVMTHIAHHRHSDTPLDPHPPEKISTTLMGQYPKVETRGLRRYATSKFNRIMHRYYFLILAVYGLVWGMLGTEFFFYGFLYPMMLTVIASNFVNKYAHSDSLWFNYRLHNTKDSSQNSPIVAWLTWGEGWHNTHHKFPGRASFSMKPSEVDISFLFVQLLEKLGLAKIKSRSF